jgi:hypothetical protein
VFVFDRRAAGLIGKESQVYKFEISEQQMNVIMAALDTHLRANGLNGGAALSVAADLQRQVQGQQSGETKLAEVAGGEPDAVSEKKGKV